MFNNCVDCDGVIKGFDKLQLRIMQATVSPFEPQGVPDKSGPIIDPRSDIVVWLREASDSTLAFVFECCRSEVDWIETECDLAYLVFVENWAIERPESFDRVVLEHLECVTGELRAFSELLIDICCGSRKQPHVRRALEALASRVSNDGRGYILRALQAADKG